MEEMLHDKDCQAEVFMKMVIKQCILLFSIAMIAGGCSEPVKSFPSIYEMNENQFSTYDETVVIGQQVDAAIKLYKESLAIIVVKEGQNYIFGDNQAANTAAGDSQAIPLPLKDKDEVINRQGIYKSSILRNEDGEVIGIRLTERNKME
ncbi:hypothetical protein ACPV3A_29660 [Paenibacillus sp. Dod16]|uniref:hypothetical protein n=1 Tax=Paenibacillus sp. Dod16 TaxID=3416392 RepID=UPI003CF44222